MTPFKLHAMTSLGHIVPYPTENLDHFQRDFARDLY